MKNRITNQLDMAGTCIDVASRPLYAPLFSTQPPLDFVADIAVFKTEYASVSAAAVLAYAATTGPAEAKDIAETVLEDLAYPLARAECIHFKKTGNLTDRAKVDFTKSALVRLRDQELKNACELIRDLGNQARDDSGALGRGITQARVLTLTGAIDAYGLLMRAPRGQVAGRAGLIRDVETRVAALMERLRDLDDLVLQYGDTELGRAFIATWQAARIIVDAGHGHSTPTPTPTPTPAP